MYVTLHVFGKHVC